MATKQLIAILAVAVIVVAGVGVYFATADNNKNTTNNDSDESTVVTVEDSAGRTVTVPDSLDNGIVTVGWNILKVLSFFDAHEKVTQVDYQETQTLYGSLQPHYYCYDMSKITTHTDSTMGGFTESDIESIANSNPSLVIMTKNIYDKYQTGSDALAKACTLVVIDLTSMSSSFYTADESGNLVLQDDIQKSLSILGDVLGESDRDEEVISTLNSTLADITANKIAENSPLFSLAGSQMAMGTGDLNLVFPVFPPFALAGATNAASEAGYTVPPWYATVPVETFTSTYDFDVIMYDPSNPAALANPDDQSVLEWLYGLQDTENEKSIYICLTTALCGFDMLNVVSDAYFTEVVGGTITLEQMESKMTALYKSLFGDSVGASLWSDLVDCMTDRGEASGVYTGLWEQVEVVKNTDGTYTFGDATA